MSSPLRRGQSPRSSPLNRFKRSVRHGSPNAASPNGFRPGSSYRENTASPSRQIAEELSRVYISDTKAFKLSLDIQDDEQEKLHRQALIKSLAEHEAVREGAERARQRVELEIEYARQRLAAEERQRIEEERQRVEKQQRELKAKEDAKRQQALAEQQAKEAEVRKREEEKRKQDQVAVQERQAKEKAAQEELAKQQAAQRQKEEQEARKQAEAVKVAPVVNGTAPVVATTQSDAWQSIQPPPVLTPQGIVSTADQREAEHQRYMTMHKKLKEMRKWVTEQAKTVPGLPNQLSEMRRDIKKKLSMFNAVDKTLNRKPTADITAALDSAAKMTQISIVPKDFIVALDQEQGSDAQYPAALLYLLNYFAKYVILRFTDQVGRDPKSAEPYGVLLVTIFGSASYHYRNHSLIDILWAKYHKVCPVLFGINGDGKTVLGKHRLGWKFEKDFESTKPGAGAFIGAEEHLGNQAGLATGFAAITLRDFARSKKVNPAPNRMFWTSMARILSCPAPQRTSTHFVVARNMIELYVPRFILFFGSVAIAALRKLFKEWPREAADKKDPSVLALDGLPRFFERDYQLYL